MAERKKREYLVDRIFPHTEIHLIGGPSGAGKTRWLFQTFIGEWQHGRPVLGYSSHPCSWVYITGDRSQDDAEETLLQLRYPVDSMPIYSAVDWGKLELTKILEQLSAVSNPPKLFVVEGLASLTPDGCDLNKYKDVANFLAMITRFCKTHNITIIGVVHSPKMKEDSQYLNPRQRIMGSAAWAAYSGTVVMIEPTKAGSAEEATMRKLILLPRNAPESYLDMQFNADGRLVEVDEALNDVLFDTFLRSYKASQTFKTADALDKLENCMSPATVHRLLLAAVTNGYIEKLSHGVYRVKHKS